MQRNRFSNNYRKIKYEFESGNRHQINFKYGLGMGLHKKLPENTCLTGSFSINGPYSYHIKKEKDLSRQIKSEVGRLKADFFANHMTDNLENGILKPLFAHIKRSRGQSSHINRAC